MSTPDLILDPRARDWWLVPTEVIEGTNDTIILNGTTITIPGGARYWPHRQPFSPLQGLFFQLADDAATAGVDIQFRTCTPTSSDWQFYGGLQFHSPNPFTIDFNDPLWNLDKRLFGYPKSYATQVTAVLNPASGRYETCSPFTMRTIWRSYTQSGNGKASIKRMNPVSVAPMSHRRVQDRFANVWERQNVRTWLYENVPGGHVWENDAANLESYAEFHRLGLGDTHNAFETIYSAILENEIAIVIHDTENFDLDWDIAEAVGLSGEAQLAAAATVTRTAGDFVRLAFATDLVGAI
jgi:hypothetical protein